MNSMAISFDALIRSGVRSRASILVDTSIASTISIPSVSTLSISSDERGRAMATTISDSAAILSRKGTCRKNDMNDLPLNIHGTDVETLRCGRF